LILPRFDSDGQKTWGSVGARARPEKERSLQRSRAFRQISSCVGLRLRAAKWRGRFVEAGGRRP